MDTLHKHKYDISKAIASLVPPGGPVLCRDEMEEWSASEANLFEEALDKYGKDFNDIRQDFVRLPINQLPFPIKIVKYYFRSRLLRAFSDTGKEKYERLKFLDF